jgi:heptosyltransferase-2
MVVQTAFLGDIVLTTAFLHSLRALLPKAEIFFVTTPLGVEVLKPNSWDIELIPFDKRRSEKGPRGLLKKIRQLRRLKPELVFSLHRSFRSTILATSLGAETTLGFREAAASFLFTNTVSRKRAEQEGEKNALLLREAFPREEIRENPPTTEPLLFLAKEEEKQAEALFSPFGKETDFVAFAASSVWATKRWPAERFGELALLVWRKYHLRTVIVGGAGAEDRKVSADVVDTFRGLANDGELGFAPLDLSGKTNMGTLKAVLAKAKLVVANDSAPLHIATALQVPVVGIFGPTTKSLGFFPHAGDERSAVVEKKSLSCRPCGKHGHKKCPLVHVRCMLEIEPTAVMAAIEPWLGDDLA